MSFYASFVRKHAHLITPLEDALRAATIFLPGRFSTTTEVSSEAVYTALNLLSLLHDSILSRQRVLVFDLSLHGPETSSVLDDKPPKATFAKVLKHILTVLHYSEVLLELVARKYVPRNTTLALLSVELAKAVARLGLLVHNRGRMVYARSAPLAEAHRFAAQEAAIYKAPVPDEPFEDVRELYRLHGRSSAQPHGRFSPLTNKAKFALSQEELEAETRLPQRAEVCGEVLHMLRPVVYLALRWWYRREPGSWKPLVGSFLVDVASRLLSLTAKERLSAGQRSELQRRLLLWFYYLFRDPLFSRVTRPPLDAVSSALQRLPLLGPVAKLGTELLLNLQSVYFYTAASSY